MADESHTKSLEQLICFLGETAYVFHLMKLFFLIWLLYEILLTMKLEGNYPLMSNVKGICDFKLKSSAVVLYWRSVSFITLILQV